MSKSRSGHQLHSCYCQFNTQNNSTTPVITVFFPISCCPWYGFERAKAQLRSASLPCVCNCGSFTPELGCFLGLGSRPFRGSENKDTHKDCTRTKAERICKYAGNTKPVNMRTIGIGGEGGEAGGGDDRGFTNPQASQHLCPLLSAVSACTNNISRFLADDSNWLLIVNNTKSELM